MILVTGGAGYIGSHTCLELLAQGRDILILDNFSNSNPEVISRLRQLSGKEIPCFEADLCLATDVARVFREYPEIDAVIHFAGLKAVGESVREPLRYYQNNLTGTLNLIDAMRKAGVSRLIFSSSATVYRSDNIPPYTEDMPLWCTNPYGFTKLMIEQILRDLCQAWPDLSVVLLRYFNPIGAHPSGLIGEDPSGIPNNLMPYISKVAVGKLPLLHVFGNDYPTTDGTGVRDYIHVCDLARGHICALTYAEAHKGAVAVNLGTGNGYSVLDVIHAFEAASGVKIPYQIDPRRAGDLAVSFADAQKAKQLFCWKAEKGLGEMCADSWRWQQQNPNGYSENQR